MNDRTARLASLAVAGLGLADAIYLSWIKLSHQTAACSAAGDCSTVNNSIYAEIAGVPIAVFGAGAYVFMILILGLESRVQLAADHGPWLVYGVSLAGVLYSAYLTYIELFVIKAICPFCVFSALALVVLLILSGIRLFRPSPENESADPGLVEPNSA